MRKRLTAVFALVGPVLFLAGCLGVTSEALPPPGQASSPSGVFTFTLPPGAVAAAGEDPRCGQAGACWAAENFTLILEEADAGDATDVAAYVDAILPALVAGTEGTQLLGRMPATTAGGLAAAQTELSTQDGLVRVLEQWVLSDGRALRLYFTAFSDGFEDVRPVAEATFLSVAAGE